jgi:hypothetical protein
MCRRSLSSKLRHGSGYSADRSMILIPYKKIARVPIFFSKKNSKDLFEPFKKYFLNRLVRISLK